MRSPAHHYVVPCVAALILLGATASSAAAETLTVVHPTPGGGYVTSSPAGINCETFFCSAEFASGSSVTLTSTPRKGFAFAGYSESCAGPSCTVTMDGYKTVRVDFIRFAPIPYSKVKKNTKNGTATITIRVGGPGRLVVRGQKVKRQERAPAAASNVKLPIVATGTAATALENQGNVKVSVKVTFTPSEGTPSSLSQPVRLIRAPSGP